MLGSLQVLLRRRVCRLLLDVNLRVAVAAIALVTTVDVAEDAALSLLAYILGEEIPGKLIC